MHTPGVYTGCMQYTGIYRGILCTPQVYTPGIQKYTEVDMCKTVRQHSKQQVVMASLCRFDPKDFDHAVLVLGDTGGGVCAMEFLSATTSLFGVQTSSKQGAEVPAAS